MPEKLSKSFHLSDLLEIVVSAAPTRDAIIDEAGTVSFAMLEARVKRLARLMHEGGVGRGDKVGLYLRNSRTYVEALFACFHLGAVPFNVNYRYTQSELIYLFDNADARAVIFEPDFKAHVEALCHNQPEIVFSLENSAVYEESLNAARPMGDVLRDEGDYLLLYTGGTTGAPKGVMWPHKDFFYACLGGGGIYLQAAPIARPEEQAVMVENGPDIRIFPLAPLMHGAAIWTALASLLGGIPIILDTFKEGFDATSIWSRVEETKANIIQIVGDAMAEPLLACLRANPGRWDTSSVIVLGSGGAVFSESKKQGFRALMPNLIITDGMGASETGISGMAQAPDKGGMMRLEANDVQRVVVGDRFAEVGELGFLARGGYLPMGYYKDEAKSAEVFKRIEGSNWAVSGDQAQLDSDGMITIFGRGATCINTGGEKVYPEEVEEVLRDFDGVLDSAVVGIADEKWGQAVAAIVSLNAGVEAPEPDEIKSFCRQHLAAYKVPKTIKFVPHVERSPAGKQNYKWVQSLFSVD